MRFTTSLVLSAALAAASAMAQSGSGSGSMSSMPMNTSAGGMQGIDLSMIPPCFKACGQTAATSKEIGCQGAADFKCICSKPSYQEVTSKCVMTSQDNDCPKLKMNSTAIEMGVKVLQGICAQASGSGGNMTAGGMSGSMPGMNSSMPASGSGSMPAGGSSSATNSSSMPKKNSAAGLNVPNKEFVASVAIVLSTLSIGALALA